MKKIYRFLFVLFVIVILCINTIANADDNLAQFDIKAKSAVLMEASTGKVLFEQNSHEKLPPASVTKVMTMLLIMEAIDSKRISYDDVVVTSEYAAGMGGSQVFLSTGEQMKVKEMLKAIAVASGNDASVAMAEHISGTEEAFVNAMNKRARELGMTNTNFINCNGLDADNHYTTAYDIALMSRELLKHHAIHEYLTIWIDALRNGEFGLANTNKLIRFYSGANGIKTGSTGKALYCLAGAAKRDGMQLIATIMAAPTSKERFYYASKLMDYGFANYTIIGGVSKSEEMGEIDVIKGMDKKVKYVAEQDFSVLIEKINKNSVQKEVNLSQNILAPVEKGQKVGEIVFKADNKELGRVNLVTDKEIPKIVVGKVFKKLISRWMNSQD